MELHVIAVPRHPDIAAVPIHTRRRQHMRPIDGHALRFMDGGGIPVIDMGIVLEVERGTPAAIEALAASERL